MSAVAHHASMKMEWAEESAMKWAGLVSCEAIREVDRPMPAYSATFRYRWTGIRLCTLDS